MTSNALNDENRTWVFAHGSLSRAKIQQAVDGAPTPVPSGAPATGGPGFTTASDPKATAATGPWFTTTTDPKATTATGPGFTTTDPKATTATGPEFTTTTGPEVIAATGPEVMTATGQEVAAATGRKVTDPTGLEPRPADLTHSIRIRPSGPSTGPETTGILAGIGPALGAKFAWNLWSTRIWPRPTQKAVDAPGPRRNVQHYR